MLSKTKKVMITNFLEDIFINMKIKKTSILFVILVILMFTATQSVFALDNATSDENIAGDFENELTADDFSIPDNVDVNSTKKVEIDINTTQSVAKDDLTLKLNKSGSVSDISDFELENKKIKFDLADNDFEKAITLRVIDSNWVEHMNAMEHLKEGIGLRGYGQVNPIQAYTMEWLRAYLWEMYLMDIRSSTMRSMRG